jgi:hypothetical protein
MGYLIGFVVVVVVVVVAVVVLRKPKKSPVGSGGVLRPPVPPAVPLPANALVDITPKRFPDTVDDTGVWVGVTTKASGSAIRGVSVKVRIGPGGDGGVSSEIDIGTNPSTGGRWVGSGLDSATDQNGVCSFTLRATADGDDEITITVDPGGAQQYDVSYSYETEI